MGGGIQPVCCSFAALAQICLFVPAHTIASAIWFNWRSSTPRLRQVPCQWSAIPVSWFRWPTWRPTPKERQPVMSGVLPVNPERS